VGGAHTSNIHLWALAARWQRVEQSVEQLPPGPRHQVAAGGTRWLLSGGAAGKGCRIACLAALVEEFALLPLGLLPAMLPQVLAVPKVPCCILT